MVDRDSPEFRVLNAVPPSPDAERSEIREPNAEVEKAPSPELLALFRLLIREPPAEHDFGTCPTCKEYGITSI